MARTCTLQLQITISDLDCVVRFAKHVTGCVLIYLYTKILTCVLLCFASLRGLPVNDKQARFMELSKLQNTIPYWVDIMISFI